MSEAKKLFPENEGPAYATPAVTEPAAPGLSAIESALRRRANWSVALGIGMMILGILCWGAAAYTTVATVFFIGSLMVVGAIVQLVEAFRWKGWGQFFLHLAGGLLYGITGILLWRAPVAGAAVLTLLMASFFLVSGVFRIVGASMLRIGPWGWAVASGVISVILGLWVYGNLGLASLFLIGAFVGIDLIFDGLAMMAVGMEGRRLASAE